MAFGIGATSVADILGTIKIQGLDKAIADLSKLGQSAETAAKHSEMANKAMTLSIVAAATALTAAVVSAGAFEKQMAMVNTLLPFTTEEFANLNKGVLEIAKSSPASIASLTSGLYDLISSGATASTAIGSLALASQAATAGMTGVDIAVRAGQGTLNAYNLTADKLNEIFDYQFMAVNKGVLTYEQFGGAIGNVLPSAAALGVKIPEVYGAVARLTQVNIDAQSATTYLARAFGSMIEQSDDWKKFGVSIFDANGKFRDMVPIIGELAGKLGKLTDEQMLKKIRELVPEERAAKAVQVLVQNYDAFKKVVEEVGDAGGAMKAAYDKANNTLSAQAGILKNQLQVAFIEMGNVALPVLKGLISLFNEHPAALQGAIQAISTLVIGVGTLAAGMKAFKAVSAIWAAGFGPVGLILTGIAVAIIGITAAIKDHNESQLREITQTSENIGNLKILEGQYNALKDTKNRTKEQDILLEQTTMKLKQAYLELGINIWDTDQKFGHMNEEIKKQKISDLETQVRELNLTIKQFGNISGGTTKELTKTGKKMIVYGEDNMMAALSVGIFSKGQEKAKEKLKLVQEELKQLHGETSTHTSDISKLNALGILTNKQLKDQISSYKALQVGMNPASSQYKQLADLINQATEKLKLNTAGIKDTNINQKLLTDVNKESTASIKAQIAEYNALIPIVKDDANATAEITTKVNELYAKLNLVNPATAKLTTENYKWKGSLKAVSPEMTNVDGLTGGLLDQFKNVNMALPKLSLNMLDVTDSHKGAIPIINDLSTGTARSAANQLIASANLDEYNKIINEGKPNWAEQLGYIRQLTEALGLNSPVLKGIIDLGGLYGASLEDLNEKNSKIAGTTNDVSTNFLSVLSNINPLALGLNILSIGMDLLGVGEEVVRLTTDDVKASMGELGIEMDKMNGIVGDLATKFQSNILTALKEQNELILQLKTNYLNLGGDGWGGMGWIAVKVLELKTGFTDFDTAIKATIEEIKKLNEAFAFSTAFTTATDSITYLTDEAIRMKTTFGNMAWPGLTTLLNESIALNEAMLKDLDPLSIAYITMSNNVAKAKDSVLVLNGAMTTQDYNLKWLSDDTDIFTEAVVLNAGKLLTWQEQLTNTTAAGTKWNSVLEGLAWAGIESADSIEENNSNWLLLIPNLEKGTLQWEQAIIKFSEFAATNKLANPYLAEYNDLTGKAKEVTLTWMQVLESTAPQWDKLKAAEEGFAAVGIKTEDSIYDQMDALYAIYPYVKDNEYMYGQWKDKMGALYVELGLTNPYLSEQEILLGKLSAAGIETSDSVQAQIDALVALIPSVKAGSYEYEQIVSKLAPLYTKLDQINPYIVAQTADVIGLMDAWKTFTDAISGKFDVFEKDAAAVLTQLDNISYFKLDIDTEGYQESIGASIYATQQYVDSLNPDSQAWKDANATLQSLITKFVELGGDVANIKPTIDSTEVIAGAAIIDQAILDMATVGTETPIPLTVDLKNLNTSILTASNTIDQAILDMTTVGTETPIPLMIDLENLNTDILTANNAIVGVGTTAANNPAVLGANGDAATVILNAFGDRYIEILRGVEDYPITVGVNTATAFESINSIWDALEDLTKQAWSTTVTVTYEHEGGVLHGGGLVMHGGGNLYGEGAELLKAHSGLNLGTGGREEVPFIGLKGEYVMRNAFVDKYGVEEMDYANRTLDGGVFGQQQNTNQQQNEKPVFNVIYHNPRPDSWIQITDGIVHPRIKKNELYTTQGTQFKK